MQTADTTTAAAIPGFSSSPKKRAAAAAAAPAEATLNDVNNNLRLLVDAVRRGVEVFAEAVCLLFPCAPLASNLRRIPSRLVAGLIKLVRTFRSRMSLLFIPKKRNQMLQRRKKKKKKKRTSSKTTTTTMMSLTLKIPTIWIFNPLADGLSACHLHVFSLRFACVALVMLGFCGSYSLH
jgi:hypothetical protein